MFDEKVANPFYNISEAEAASLGLAKVAEADGSVIWRIDPMPETQNLKQPEIAMKLIPSYKGTSLVAQLSAPQGTVWKNPNPFGCNRGCVKITGSNGQEIMEFDTFLKVPLAISEYRPHTDEISIEVPLEPGIYNITASFPEILTAPLEFELIMGKTEKK